MIINLLALVAAPLIGLIGFVRLIFDRSRWRRLLACAVVGSVVLPVAAMLTLFLGIPLEFFVCSHDCGAYEDRIELLSQCLRMLAIPSAGLCSVAIVLSLLSPGAKPQPGAIGSEPR